MDASIKHSDIRPLTDRQPITDSGVYRVVGITYGFGNQLLFVITVWYLFWFLRDGAMDQSHRHWFMRDCGLAIFFAISHSFMLVPRTRKYLTKWIPRAFYDSTFCVVTCVSLLMLFFGWRSSEWML